MTEKTQKLKAALDAEAPRDTQAPQVTAALPTSEAIGAALDDEGAASLGVLLAPGTCCDLAALFDDDSRFRSHIRMARHGFGQGEYKYFAAPLPEVVTSLRAVLYAALAPIANTWMDRLGRAARYPRDLSAFTARCHAAGQLRPTPLLLRYRSGDYNCLHQDLYGDLAFPLQVVIGLSRPGEDFSGGQFVLSEQRPRMQSRATVFDLKQGEALVFATNERPRRRSASPGKTSRGGTAPGYARSIVRHGVSTVRSGERLALGIIFHDAA